MPIDESYRLLDHDVCGVPTARELQDHHDEASFIYDVVQLLDFAYKLPVAQNSTSDFRVARRDRYEQLALACDRAQGDLRNRTSHIPARICGDPRSHDLTPLEVAAMGALISLARVANTSQHYEKTFKAGKESIELESILHGEFKAE